MAVFFRELLATYGASEMDSRVLWTFSLISSIRCEIKEAMYSAMDLNFSGIH